MSRASSPAVPWDQLATWLETMTTSFLPKDTSDLQHLSQGQLDTEMDQLMANDPTQSYTHKELARITGTLAHLLIAQARISERSNHDLEQEAAALRLRVEEALQHQAHTQSRLDKLLLETQDQHEKENATDPELQKEVERLQNALENLRLDTDQREHLERETRERLEAKLRQGDTLLERAEIELKERDAKVKAYENHLEMARAEIHDLTQRKDSLIDELDMVHRELKHSYSLQREQKEETHSTEFPLASEPQRVSQELRAGKGGESLLFKMSPASLHEPLSAVGEGKPFQKVRVTSHGHITPKELDKLARNIPTFNPDPAGGHDIHAYLQDIDFHLQTVTNVTTWDKLYLLRITSSREVRSFLDRQPETVKMDYQQLRKALVREFSDPESDQGLVTAMDLKQGRLETPPNFYNRLRRAYFGARNEPGMEEDVNFRTLFLRNLHPTVSHHLGVLACPRSMSTQQLRDLAHKAYTKQKTVSEKTVKHPTICSVSESHSELTLEGAQQYPSYTPINREKRPFQASRGQRGRGGGARPKHQNDRSGISWDRPRPSHNQKGGATWEAGRRPRTSQPPASRTPSPGRREGEHSRRDTWKLKAEPTSKKESAATSEAAELLRILREFLQQKPHKEDKKDKPDTA
ncbi:uncharacterized protein LOC113074454 [Carassius auratus]|uniref:Uncharacterized protein LOC113074454 n=1 Tax=Carassius auratus TaxID=7957 RepID=A0A6P6N236_CARAU|nr:uncharacterized protein LOC113074454 [Carassius auratus]